MKAQKRKLGLLEVDGASEREQNFGERAEGVELSRIGRSLGNSDRAFYKELAKVIEASDAILEVLDARDPLGTRCYDMEKMVLKAGPHKNLVLLLNKIAEIPYYAIPPSRKQDEQWARATIVSKLGKEFNNEEAYKGESPFIGSLMSVEDFHHTEVPPSCPLIFY